MRSWKTPTPDQVTKTLARLVRAEHRRYFFDRLNNPEWIIPLRDRGFFATPPPPIKSPDDRSIRFPPWPESHFLSRVASEAPTLVKEVVLGIPGTENITVHHDFVDAALAMPPVAAVEIAARETAWMNETNQRFAPSMLPEKLGLLASHLAKGGARERSAALELTRSLLAVFPGERKARLSPEPQCRMRDWDYQQILNKNVPDLVKAAPEDGLKLLCDLLIDAVRSSFREEAKYEPPEDISTAWRRAVEESPQDFAPTTIQGVRGLLVSGLRDSAERAVGDQLLPIADAVRILEDYRWLIFQRIGLHVLRRFPEGAPDLVVERLVDADRFATPYASRLLHEYALLLREQFRHLTAAQQATILGWIDHGPDVELVKVRYEENMGKRCTDEWADHYRKRWQQNRLAMIRDDLSPDWRARYEQLVAELGEPEHPEFQSYSSGVQSGPTSPINASAIGSLTMPEIVSRIEAFQSGWTPSNDISSPTPDGLSSELRAAVAAEPERFVREIDSVKGLPATYVRGVVSGLDEAARQNRLFDWGPVVELCGWVVAQPRGGASDAPKGVFDPFDVDRDWTRARSAASRLLATALENDQRGLSFALRDAVWGALLPLTSDPEPDEEYESKYLEGSGPAHVSINTIRGEALHAVVRYALWVRKHLNEAPGGHASTAKGLDGMPEVRAVFDAHLDTRVDPSLAIRSVYGQWFPWLHLIDPQWAIANAARIFPPDEMLRRYWAAAWSTYVIFSGAYDNVFDVLRREYARAIERLGDSDVNIERTEQVDERLAEHLVLLYGRGCIALDEVDSLIVRFFEKADAALRAQAIQSAGWILARSETPIPPDFIDRMKKLWEARLNATRTSPEVHQAELRAFSSWFTSRKFNDEWALAQLSNVLRLIDHLEHDYHVVERLAEITAEHPLRVIECLRLLIDGDKEGWRVYQWRTAVRKALEAAKECSDPSVLEAVDDVVNRLGARGLFEFRDLLS